MEFTMKLQKAAAIALFAIAATPTFAQTTVGQKYFGLEIGSSKVDNATGELTSALVSSLGGSASATQDASLKTFKILVGYKHSDNIDLEAAYLKSSDINLTFAGTTRGGTSYAGLASQSLSGLEFSTNLRPDVSTGFNNAFLKLGVHNFTADSSLRVTSGSASVATSSSESGSGTLYGFGYDHPMGNGANIRFAYTKYNKVAGGDISGAVIGVGFTKQF
jgi:hypothetical protein